MQPSVQVVPIYANVETNLDDVSAQETTFRDGHPATGTTSVPAEQSRTWQSFAKSQGNTTTVRRTDNQSQRLSQVSGVSQRAQEKNCRSLSLGSSQPSDVQVFGGTNSMDESNHCATDLGHHLTPPNPKRVRSSQTSFQPIIRKLPSEEHSAQASTQEEDFIELPSSSPLHQPPSSHSLDGLKTNNPKQRNSSAPEISTFTSYSFSYPDSTSSEDNMDESPGTTTLEVSPILQQSIPDFKVKHDPWGVVATTYSVFDLMKKPILKENSDEGRIYIARVKNYPGIVKIGRTTKPIQTRLRQIQRCIKHKLELVDDDKAHSPISNHGRVETLIHQELRTYRRYFLCPCKKRARQDDDKLQVHKCTTKHDEWFEISDAKACEVVTRWKSWMSSGPYSDGKLRSKELLRISAFGNDAALVTSMVGAPAQSWHRRVFMVLIRLCRAKDLQDRKILKNSHGIYWNWDFFFRLSGIYLDFLEYHDWIFGQRPTYKSNCSRWESLCKHWDSNLLFSLLISAVYIIGSLFSHFFPGSVPMITVTNILLIGGLSILYAA